MPGIVGFAGKPNYPQGIEHVVGEMRDSLKHFSSYVDHAVVRQGDVTGARTTPGIIGRAPQPYQQDGLVAWMEGEIYNAQELLADPSVPNISSDPELLATLLRRDPSGAFLDEIDGIYSAVVFDTLNEQVHFFTDRYGLQNLYYTQLKAGLAWSCETKAFLKLSDFDRKIDETSVANFFEYGYLRDNDTWFANAKLFPPAAWWTWSIREGKFTRQHQYWGWDRIKIMEGPIDVAEVAEELARRFRQAVHLRAESDQQVGVLLSGGLDSRAIFAAFPEHVEPIHAVTLGSPTCDDVRIARRVAALRPSRHTVLDLNEENWYENRENFIWWLDGQQDMRHAHFAPHLEETRRHITVNISGFLGDAISGGSYLAYRRFSEIELLENRGRRWIGHAMHQERLLGHTRLPFYDYHYLSLAMSVPVEWRMGAKMHVEMLQRLMPRDYCDITWQTTGSSISPDGIIPYRRIMRIGRAFLRRAQRRLGWRSTKVDFHNYAKWLAAGRGREALHSIFNCCELPLITPYVKSFDVELLNRGRFTADDVSLLSRAVTLELWLQYVTGARQIPQGA